ncbi:hypothetical protein ColKHC_07522 [Colletotrichum higginsianum]|nr:hypothetical protein ColKHC_07522 [Colletotrichum higginsianum]
MLTPIDSTHLKGVQPFRDSGVWKMGGPILHELPANEEPSSLKVLGSTIVCVAESKEEIMEMLKRDVYVDRGVWDLERVQMWPGTIALLSAEVPSDIWQKLELRLPVC